MTGTPDYRGGLQNASELHRSIWCALRGLFPQYTLLEEEPLQVNLHGRDTTLRIDIVVKELRLAVEAHGRQHFEHVEHFHGSRNGFGESVQRDQAKAKAIQDVGYAYLMIPYTERAISRTRLMRMISKAIGD
jgi:G:T-mismatch repair DNA endonuclease (very short patch repair protein)